MVDFKQEGLSYGREGIWFLAPLWQRGEQQVDDSGKQSLIPSQKELSKDGEGCFGG